MVGEISFTGIKVIHTKTTDRKKHIYTICSKRKDIGEVELAYVPAWVTMIRPGVCP